MKHRISVGALVLRDDRLLLARHRVAGKYDFWAPPGGGIEGEEQLSEAVQREAFEETQISVKAKNLAYIDELIDDTGRMVKFWYLCDYVSGEIDIRSNPDQDEAIVDAGWFAQNDLPNGHVFPEILRGSFWDDLKAGVTTPKKQPLRSLIFWNFPIGASHS